MSASPPPAKPAAAPQHPDTIRIYSHSMLFYFWPVWTLGYFFALWTFFGGHRVALVPQLSYQDIGVLTALEKHDLPANKVSVIYADEKLKQKIDLTELHMTASPLPGVIFTITLGFVLFVTNVSLRGLMSYLVLGVVALFLLTMHSLDLLKDLKTFAALLDIRINMGGYLFISTLLLAIWCLTFIFFDRQIYIIFSTGQVKVCAEVGEGEKVYDVTGLHFEKLRSDFFRHYILGLGFLGMGSGDLVVHTSGADSREFRFDNVLNIDKKIKDIEALIGAKRQVTMAHV